MSLVAVREIVPGDLNYVISSWVESYHDHSTSRISRMPAPEFFRRWRRVVNVLIRMDGVSIACPSDDPDTVLAWVCASRGRVHYAHAKRGFQRLGLMRLLLGVRGVAWGVDAPVLYSHRTADWDAMPKPDLWRYAPWLLIGV